MRHLCGLVLLMTMLNYGSVFSQNKQQNAPSKQYLIGSSLLMLANLSEDSPEFYQLNFGFYLTSKDIIAIEFLTFKHKSPLTIPYGPSFSDPDENYPGYVRQFGIGPTYQRFLWKKFYSSVNVSPHLRNYFTSDNDKIQSGFELFCTLRAGYRFTFLKNRLFLEPSVGFNFYPIRTNTPDSFEVIEKQWPDYFLFDPGFHFGVNF